MSGAFAFDGRVVLVTGAAGGIGTVIVACGAAVVLADLNEAVYRTAAVLGSDMVRSIGLEVRDAESCLNAVQVAVDTFGGLDALVNNAGVTVRKDAVSTSDVEWHRSSI